jgi:oligopeptide transport system substrate-binding protein
MRASSACLVASLALTLLTTSCAKREAPIEVARRAGILHVGNNGEPSELDPHVINASPDYQIITALFEGLLNTEPKTLAPTPGVAERWEISADGLAYTFHLRPGARWSNGEALTAADFLYSFRRALSPALASQYTFLYSAVRGADEFASGKLADFSPVGFAAPDPRTVVVTLKQPTPYFLGVIAGNPVWYPVHRATIERRGKIDQRGTAWTRPETFVGNGPFVVKQWRPNQVIVLEKSPHYWDATRVHVSTVHLHAMDDLDAQERAFRAGQLHVARLPPAKANAYLEAKSPLLLRLPMLSVTFLAVNVTRGPLRDVRVRRALSLALDRAQFSARIQPARTSPAFSIVPDGMPGFTSAPPPKEDAARARALLAEASFPGGANFPVLELSSENAISADLVQALQETWRTQLGITIKLLRRESRTHWNTLHLKEYDLAVSGWSADYPDATTFLDLWRSNGGWNFTHWADTRYDALLAAAATERDPARRLSQLQEAETRLLDEAAIIPLSFDRNLQLVQPMVQDWFMNVLQRPDYKSVRFSP